MNGSQSLLGKVVAITGGTGDIGNAVAVNCIERGANVVIIDRQLATDSQRDDYAIDPERSLLVQADVTDEASFRQALLEGHKRFGRISSLINNAGIEGLTCHIDEYPKDVFEAVLAVNATAVFVGMKLVIPMMLKAGGGSIVNLSSTAGLKGVEGLCAYSASKHAVIGLTRTAALEWGRHNIRVNCVCPGPINGRMISSIQHDPATGHSEAARNAREIVIPIRRYGQASEVAEVIAFLASDAASLVNGACYSADGGISAM